MADTLTLQLTTTPSLRAPVLLAAFAGWGDGALAGSGAIQHLLNTYETQRLGGFDPDDIYDYTSVRPIAVRKETGERELIWPALDLHACPLPDGQHDLLLLMGPEPSLRWRSAATALVETVRGLGAVGVIVLGSYWDRVTHLGRPLLTGRATEPIAIKRLQALDIPESGYQGPTGFSSALLDACARARLLGIGLSARAPHYAQNMTHPPLSYGLLEAVQRLAGLTLNLEALQRAAEQYERLLTERAQQEPRLWQYIQQRAAELGQAPARHDFGGGLWTAIAAGAPPGTEAPSPPSGPPQLPTPAEAVSAVEEFLRRASRGQ